MEEVISAPQPLKENPKLTVNDFELLKTIGKGSFGKVFEVRFPGGNHGIGAHEGDGQYIRDEGDEQIPNHGVALCSGRNA